jgi:hypothetical protein
MTFQVVACLLVEPPLANRYLAETVKKESGRLKHFSWSNVLLAKGREHLLKGKVQYG